ncbi:MAG TPA: gamma-glutamylcyclotransferase family protein [Saprospiraceae bacterium]|nr:gamma-glutamylcyclotransferase family protein [Saprospiraceae bacterium]
MFTYFGYGSNINLISLRAKGVDPISSERGLLRGWRLRFNVQHWFQHEGGVGNIEPSPDANDFVEGMVHTCRDEHLASLDAMEAYGVGYDRIEVDLETDHGRVKAFAYIGLPAFLDDSCLPTRRYLNIILKGAEAAGLSKAYIDKLRQHPIHIAEEYPEFEYPSGQEAVFTEQTLAAYPYLTVLAGAVFDMRSARSQLDSLARLVGGKDMTLFYLKRHDSSDGTETLDDVIQGRISPEGKKYLNAYLHAYAREFKYAGRYVYHDPLRE